MVVAGFGTNGIDTRSDIRGGADEANGSVVAVALPCSYRLNDDDDDDSLAIGMAVMPLLIFRG
jgi:hypothetical protein